MMSRRWSLGNASRSRPGQLHTPPNAPSLHTPPQTAISVSGLSGKAPIMVHPLEAKSRTNEEAGQRWAEWTNIFTSEYALSYMEECSHSCAARRFGWQLASSSSQTLLLHEGDGLQRMLQTCTDDMSCCRTCSQACAWGSWQGWPLWHPQAGC
jgi:hypothetical protein